MRTITLQDIKRRGAKAIPDDVPVFLIVHSKTKSVLLPLHEYETLVEALEELEDMKAIEERKNEDTVPFEKVFPKEA
jgi:PHD/YefM family antitoxin component YafN of YafNO toxin-antitoxin module